MGAALLDTNLAGRYGRDMKRTVTPLLDDDGNPLIRKCGHPECDIEFIVMNHSAAQAYCSARCQHRAWRKENRPTVAELQKLREAAALAQTKNRK